MTEKNMLQVTLLTTLVNLCTNVHMEIWCRLFKSTWVAYIRKHTSVPPSCYWFTLTLRQAACIKKQETWIFFFQRTRITTNKIIQRYFFWTNSFSNEFIFLASINRIQIHNKQTTTTNCQIILWYYKYRSNSVQITFCLPKG